MSLSDDLRNITSEAEALLEASKRCAEVLVFLLEGRHAPEELGRRVGTLYVALAKVVESGAADRRAVYAGRIAAGERMGPFSERWALEAGPDLKSLFRQEPHPRRPGKPPTRPSARPAQEPQGSSLVSETQPAPTAPAPPENAPRPTSSASLLPKASFP